MKLSIFTFFLIFLGDLFMVSAQNDSLLRVWERVEGGEKMVSATQKAEIITQLVGEYCYSKPDSGILLADKGLAIDLPDSTFVGELWRFKSIAYYILGDYPECLQACQYSLTAYRKAGNLRGEGDLMNMFGLVYAAQHRHQKAIEHLLRGIELLLNYPQARIDKHYLNIGISYNELAQFDSAAFFLQKSLKIAHDRNLSIGVIRAENFLGEVELNKGNPEEALTHWDTAQQLDAQSNDWERAFTYSGLALSHLRSGRPQESLRWAQKGMALAQKVNAKWDIERLSSILAETHEALGDFEKAYRFRSKQKIYSDSLFNEEKERELNRILLAEKEAENLRLVAKNSSQEQQIYQQYATIGIIGVGLLSLAIILAVLYRNNQQKHYFNQQLIAQNREIEQQKEEILQQNEQLQQMDRSKNRLFSIIGHDLRGPIGLLKNFLDLLGNKQMSAEEFANIAPQLQQSVNSSYSTLDNLLNWGSMQLTGNPPNQLVVPIEEIIQPPLALYEETLRNYGIFMELEIPEGLKVKADPEQVKLVVRNLISNAAKFTPEGGKITVRVEAENGKVKVCICDNGKGISTEKLKEIFKLKTSTTFGVHGERGTGLGLMLSKEMVEANQGEIGAESELDKGSTFWFTLPLAIQPPQKPFSAF